MSLSATTSGIESSLSGSGSLESGGYDSYENYSTTSTLSLSDLNSINTTDSTSYSYLTGTTTLATTTGNTETTISSGETAVNYTESDLNSFTTAAIIEPTREIEELSESHPEDERPELIADPQAGERKVVFGELEEGLTGFVVENNEILGRLSRIESELCYREAHQIQSMLSFEIGESEETAETIEISTADLTGSICSRFLVNWRPKLEEPEGPPPYEKMEIDCEEPTALLDLLLSSSSTTSTETESAEGTITTSGSDDSAGSGAGGEIMDAAWEVQDPIDDSEAGITYGTPEEAEGQDCESVIEGVKDELEEETLADAVDDYLAGLPEVEDTSNDAIDNLIKMFEADPFAGLTAGTGSIFPGFPGRCSTTPVAAPSGGTSPGTGGTTPIPMELPEEEQGNAIGGFFDRLEIQHTSTGGGEIETITYKHLGQMIIPKGARLCFIRVTDGSGVWDTLYPNGVGATITFSDLASILGLD